MRHFAKVENGVVVDILGATDKQIIAGMFIGWDSWIEVRPGTIGGVYYGEDGAAPLRKNYPQIGDTYDEALDAFIPKKPIYQSWVLNTETCLWEPPVPMPADSGTGTPAKGYIWHEPTTSWVETPPSGYGWVADIGGWGVAPEGYVLDSESGVWHAPTE